MSCDPVIILPYQGTWPSDFAQIKENLTSDFADHDLRYLSIEHVGSTAVPGQAGKPVIDIHIIISAADFANEEICKAYRNAMFYGRREGSYRFQEDGGIAGRWSFKVSGREPRRNISVVAEGSLVSRSSLATRDTLREHADLRERYGEVKFGLARETFYHYTAYSLRKNGVIREILRRAGWDEGEIKAKEDLVTVQYPEIQLGGLGQ